jgi:hypothetical protein
MIREREQPEQRTPLVLKWMLEWRSCSLVYQIFIELVLSSLMQLSITTVKTPDSTFNILFQRTCTHHRTIKGKFRFLGKIAFDIDRGVIAGVHLFPSTTLNSCGHDLKLLVFGLDDVCIDDEGTK